MKTKDDGFEKVKNVDLVDTIEITGEELKEIKRAANQERIYDLLLESAMMQADTPLWVDHELNVTINENELSEEELVRIQKRVDKRIEEMERAVDQCLEQADPRCSVNVKANMKDFDEYLVDVGRFIIGKRKTTIGYIQREFKIGFNRASRILEQLAELGVIGEEAESGPRDIIMSKEDFEQLIAKSNIL